MGEKIDRASGQSDRPIIEPVGTDQPASTSTSSTSTSKRGTERGTNGTERGTNGTSTEEKKSTGLAHVETEEEKREKRNARRRELYAQKTADKKPKKVNKKKAEQPTFATGDQIGALIGTVSMIVASRPNMAHWQLTPKEIESLSNPLANMLAKSEALQGMAEHSDAIALATACVTIMVPRAVISFTQIKEMKEVKKNAGVTRATKPTSGKQGTEPKRENNTNDRNIDGANAPSGSAIGESQPFYGDALY